MAAPEADGRAALRRWLVELFATANLAFLTLDVYLAHLANDFAHAAEWIPVVFSAVAPVLLLPGLVRRSYLRGWGRRLGSWLGGASIGVGVGGMFLHLESTFFREQSLANLVYTAPFAAPLAYSGVGFLLLLNRMESSAREWGAWVVFLAMGGFVGAFAVSLGDHAQNGFFAAAEWLPVVTTAFGASFLLVAAIRPPDRRFLIACLAVMAAQALVGVLGLALHLRAAAGGAAESLEQNLIYGAPLFAPLLLPNLAILAAIGLWDALARRQRARTS